MSLLMETIQILNGQVQRLDYHNDRLNRSRNQLMCSHADIYLEDYLQIPDAYKSGVVKCRVFYGQDVDLVDFEPYLPKCFTRFQLKEIEFDYAFKYVDRSAFNQLKSDLPSSTELILTKDGVVTDTTFSNLVFQHRDGKWFTPRQPLLEGTQREFLLDEEVIEERNILAKDLKSYTHFKLINAMLGFDESEVYSIQLIENRF